MSAREGARVPPLLALAPSRLKKKSRLPRPQFRPPLFRDGVNPGYYSLSPDQLEDRQALALMAYTDVWDTLTSRDHEEDAYDQLKRWANGQPQLSDAMVPVYVFFLNAIERENGYETPPVEVRVLRRADGCVYSLVEPSDGPALGAELYAANADQMADANRRQARAAAAPFQLASRAWTLIDRVRAYVLEIRAAVGENLLGWNAAFREQFANTCAAQFGSGWGWLAYNKQTKELEIRTTANQDRLSDQSPALVPLLTVDVWEHAYYIDYRNARAKYVETFWNLVNWDFAARNFG